MEESQIVVILIKIQREPFSYFCWDGGARQIKFESH